MEEFLTGLYSNSSIPLLSALFLGLMTAISPCPLATNITAIGYISKDVSKRNKVFVNGLFYTLGRVISYTGLAFILFVGADQFKISGLFQKYGERIIGPLLIIIGIFMLDFIKLKFPGLDGLSKRFGEGKKRGYLSAVLLGMLFALAFCPYSGVLYFGMLIPMTISTPEGMALPVIFAIATAVPVIIFAWLIAYTLNGVGKFYKGLKAFEFWFRRIVAVLFIGTGIYYIVIIYF